MVAVRGCERLRSCGWSSRVSSSLRRDPAARVFRFPFPTAAARRSVFLSHSFSSRAIQHSSQLGGKTALSRVLNFQLLFEFGVFKSLRPDGWGSTAGVSKLLFSNGCGLAVGVLKFPPALRGGLPCAEGIRRARCDSTAHSKKLRNDPQSSRAIPFRAHETISSSHSLKILYAFKGSCAPICLQLAMRCIDFFASPSTHTQGDCA